MIVAVVSWHSTCLVVALYDPKQKKCTSLHRLKEDFFLETLEAVLKARKKISRLVILFGMERFSQTRQLTLFANVIAKEFSIKTSSLFIKKQLASVQELHQHLAKRFFLLRWNSVLLPRYSGVPNITKRKA